MKFAFQRMVVRFGTEVSWHHRLLDIVDIVDIFYEVRAPNAEGGIR